MIERIDSNRARLLLVLMSLFLLSIPTSALIDNCCFVDRLCMSNAEWVSGYWAFQNNECAAPSQQQPAASLQSQPQPAASTEIDNCCFVDRQCISDEEWVNGYWAFQNNQCSAPSRQQQPRSSQSQPQTETSEAVNNCCFIGWQCNADEEWTGGYFAFQQGQCDSSQSHWQAQWKRRQSAETAARNSNQQRQSGNQRGQPQQRSDQASDLVTLDTSHRRVTYLEDGTPVVIVTLPNWQVFWRQYCRLYDDDHRCN